MEPQTHRNAGYSRSWALEVVESYRRENQHACAFLWRAFKIDTALLTTLLMKNRPEWQVLKDLGAAWEKKHVLDSAVRDPAWGHLARFRAEVEILIQNSSVHLHASLEAYLTARLDELN